MSTRTIFRTVVAIIAIIGLIFMAGENPQASDYFAGCFAIIFAAALLYIVEFTDKQ